jgi:hypothetical protein
MARGNLKAVADFVRQICPEKPGIERSGQSRPVRVFWDMVWGMDEVDDCRLAALRIAGIDEPTDSRKRSSVIYRCAFAYSLRKETRLSLSEIGGLIGRDHSSVVYCLSVFERDCAVYPALRKLVVESFDLYCLFDSAAAIKDASKQ